MIRRSRTLIAKAHRSPAAIVHAAVTVPVVEIVAGAADVPVVAVAGVADAADVTAEAAVVDGMVVAMAVGEDGTSAPLYLALVYCSRDSQAKNFELRLASRLIFLGPPPDEMRPGLRGWPWIGIDLTRRLFDSVAPGGS